MATKLASMLKYPGWGGSPVAFSEGIFFFPPLHSLQSKKCMALNLAASFRNPAGMVVGIHADRSTISEIDTTKNSE